MGTPGLEQIKLIIIHGHAARTSTYPNRAGRTWTATADGDG